MFRVIRPLSGVVARRATACDSKRTFVSLMNQSIRANSMKASTAFVTSMCLLVASTNVWTSEPAAPSHQLLLKQFGADAIKVRQRGDATYVEFCFDTCDVFTWKNSIDQSATWDFVLLYEYKKGVGQEFAPFL